MGVENPNGTSARYAESAKDAGAEMEQRKQVPRLCLALSDERAGSARDDSSFQILEEGGVEGARGLGLGWARFDLRG